MTQSVLGSITLGYQLLWNRQRQLAAVELFVDGGQQQQVDAAHLLRTLRESWAGTSPDLLLCVPDAALLCDLLDHARADAPWIEIDHLQLAASGVAERVHRARSQGARLIWRGSSNATADPTAEHTAEPALLACFDHKLLSLSEGDTLLALRASRSHQRPVPGAPREPSPVRVGALYQNIPSRELLRHCLDDEGAWGLVGWPVDDVVQDVLRTVPGHQMPPADLAIARMLVALERDASMEVIEHLLAQDPVLAYRFMQRLGSASVGLREGIESLRHGLMMMGLGSLREWLLQQRVQAHQQLDLQPVFASLVLRAELMAHLLDVGVDDALTREIYLCGLFSQLDVLLGEPLPALLSRVHLPDRLLAAALEQTGPYQPYLAVARALEQTDTLSTQLLCEQHELSLEDVNRGLLRVLAAIDLPAGQARLT